MKKTTLLIIVLLAIYFPVISQSSNWVHYQDENEVKAFAFEGPVIWMVSSAGLLSYDTITHKSQVYNHANSGMPQVYPTSIAIDSNGNKWIGGDHEGLFKFDGTTWTQYTSANSGIINTQVLSLDIDSLNRLWVGCYGGVSVYDGNTWINYNNLGNGIIPTVWDIKCKNGLVWCGTNKGLAKFDGSVWFSYSTANSNIYSNNVKHLSITDNAVWLISGSASLSKFDGSTWINYGDSALTCPLPVLSREYITADDSGNVWFYTQISSQNYGIVKFNGSSCTVYDSSFFGAVITNYPWAMNYSNGSVYFTAKRLIKFDGIVNWKNYSYKTNTLQGFIFSVARDIDDSYWLGELSGGLNHFDGSNWIRYDLKSVIAGAGYIATIGIDSSGVKWIGTSKGLIKYDGLNFTSYLNNVAINKVVIDSLQNLWISTALNGAYYYDHTNFTNYKISSSGIVSDSLTSLAIDNAGTVWFGSLYRGIGSYNGLQWQVFNKTNSGLASNSIHDLKCDLSNNIWIATHDSGLVKKSGNNWYSYTLSNSGIHSNYVTELGIGPNQNVYVHDRIFDGLNWISVNDSTMGLTIWPQDWKDFLYDQWGNVIYTGVWGVDFYNYRNLNFEHYPSINGTVYYDANNNGLIDSLDKGMFNQKIVSYPDSVTSFSNSLGGYYFGKLQGNYDVTFVPQSSWTLTTDSASYNVNLGPLDASGFDFGTYAINPVDSASISLSIGFVRCNQGVPLWINYTNTGTTLLNGQIKLKTDTLVTYSSCIPAADSISVDSLIWNFSALYPGEHRLINAYFTAPTVNSLGTELNFSGIISGPGNQLLDSENYNPEVFCSYDPNDKSANPAGLGANHYTHFNDSIQYTIRFENCGNDTAFNIKIVDSLDNAFDVSSFRFVAASHPVYTSISQQGIATFRFDSIMLPCKSTNGQLSQGFIKYSVLHKPGLADPTIVTNYASIYFDANPPISTNQTLNTLSDVFAGIPYSNEKKNHELRLYPNPATQAITIISPGNVKFDLTIYNSHGSKICYHKNITGSIQMQLKNIPQGLYLYHATFSDGGNSSGKFVVMK